MARVKHGLHPSEAQSYWTTPAILAFEKELSSLAPGYAGQPSPQTFCDSFRIREATLSCTENGAWHTVDADRMNMYQAYHC